MTINPKKLEIFFENKSEYSQFFPEERDILLMQLARDLQLTDEEIISLLVSELTWEAVHRWAD